MARFSKSILAAGTYRKNGDTIRVTSEDLQTALKSHAKIRERGYKIPVIMEHSKTNDKDGLPFKSQSEQLSPRDLARYQEGWSDTLRLNEHGELEADIDVLGNDGLKLIQTVGTYISPQFGRWADPETGEVLPMAITHLALTPFPVDINQSADFRPLPDAATVTEASQLSHLVSFSMADMIDFGQKSFNFSDDDFEAKHPRDHGKFASKPGATATDDEPFTLKKEKSKKFVPKNSEGMQTNLLEKTKTTVSPADSHVKKQAESLPGQKTIDEDGPSEKANKASELASDSDSHGAARKLHEDAAEHFWSTRSSKVKSLVGNPATQEQVDEIESLRSSAKEHEGKAEYHRKKAWGGDDQPQAEPEKPKAKKTPKQHSDIGEEFHAYLSKKINEFSEWTKGRHSAGNLAHLKEQLKVTEAFKGNAPNDIRARVKFTQAKTPEDLQKAVDMLRGDKQKQMSHFDAEAAVHEKLRQFSLAESDWNATETIQFGRDDQKRADDGKWIDEGGTGSTQSSSEPTAKSAPSKSVKPAKKPKKGNHKKAEAQAIEHHKHAAKASAAGDTLTARRHVAAAYGMHLAAKHYEAGDHEKGHAAAEKAAKFAAGEIHFPDEHYESEPRTQMGQNMPFPPKPDSGDIDKDNDGIVDEVDDDFGTGLDDPDDDEDDAAEKAVEDHMPDKGDGDAETWAQIKVALKLNGVIVPDATNAHALLAGLLTAAHHTQKADTKDAMDDEPQEPEQPTQPDPQQQQTPAGGQDPRLKGTRQENAFTMSQTTGKTEVKTPKTDVKEIPLAEWTQMSQVNQKMSDRLTQLERDNYKKRIEHCFETGRKNREQCDALMALANTFQFSHAEPTNEIIRLEAKLEDAEALPEGAVWSPAERSSQMSLQTERQSGFFTTTGTMAADPAEEDADIARRFGPVPR